MKDTITIKLGNKSFVLNVNELEGKEIHSDALSCNDSVNSIFEKYDSDNNKTLDQEELKKIITDMKEAAGDDNILEEKEGLKILQKLQVSFKDMGNQYNKFIELIGNKTDTIVNNAETPAYEEKYIEAGPHSAISAYAVYEMINKPIDKTGFYLLNYCGKDIIKDIAKDEDENFKETFIKGMISKIIEIADSTKVNSKEMKSIQKEILKNGIKNSSIEYINSAYKKLFIKIKELNIKTLEHSKINNNFYNANVAYTKVFIDNNVILTNTETKQQTTIDLKTLLAPILEKYERDDKIKIINIFKNLPAEVLMDMKIEASFSKHDIAKMGSTDGFYTSKDDEITISGGSLSNETIVHELGHALDNLTATNKFQTEDFEKFKKSFEQELDNYVQADNKQYNKRDKDSYMYGGDNNYATMNEQEMFAECYCLLMLGHCSSESVITEYFPHTLEIAKELVAHTRELPHKIRH